MHFAAPFVAALAALSTAVEAKRYTCDRKQYADVAHQILNPAFFCKWYLSAPRTTSPLKKYGSRSLTKLCHCFVQNSPRVRGPFAPLHPAAPSKTCSRTYYRALRNQYSDPLSFCRFFNKVGNRPTSPVPSMNNPAALRKACSCYIAGAFPEQAVVSTTPVRTTPATTPETTPATSATDVGPIDVSTTSTTDAVSTTTTTVRTTTSAATTTTLNILPTTTTSTTARTTTSTQPTSTTTSASTTIVAGTSAGTTTFATLTSSATTSSASSTASA